MEIGQAGVTVQSVGGRILVKRVKGADGQKGSAADWAAAVDLSVGDDLDT